MCYKLDPSMFPNAAKSQLPLQRCMRFLPHHQDTGGFFVCVLRKVGELPEFDLPSIKDRVARAAEAGAAGEGEGDGEGDAEAAEGGEAGAEAAADGSGEAAEGGEAAAAAAAGKKGRERETLPPIEIARQAAQQALAAAERAIAAYEAKDVEAVGLAAADATRAAGRGGFALDMHMREQRMAAAREAREAREARAAAGPAAAAPAATDSAAEPAAAGAGPGSSAAAADVAAIYPPSWVRGGGGRHRNAVAAPPPPTAGRRRAVYLDPVVPVEDPALLKPLREYYGLREEFPLFTHLVSRSLETSRPKRVYYICDALRQLLMADEKEQLKVTATGLKVRDCVTLSVWSYARRGGRGVRGASRLLLMADEKV